MRLNEHSSNSPLSPLKFKVKEVDRGPAFPKRNTTLPLPLTTINNQPLIASMD